MKAQLTLMLCIVCICISIGSSGVLGQYSSSANVNLTMVNQIPDPAGAGELVDIRVMVENTGGGEINDLFVELVPEYPFMEVPGEDYVKVISHLNAYQIGSSAPILKFSVRVDENAIRGSNDLKFKYSSGSPSLTGAKAFGIDVTGNEYAQIVFVDKAKINPGEETDLTFTITNVGNSPLKDLVFSWSEEDGIILPVYSDDTKYVKSVGVGDSVDLLYKVVADVNAESGLYQLDLVLKYKTDSGITEEKTTKAGVFIGGETDFDVTFSESSEGQTSLSVSNTGNNPALSVTVRVPEQEGFSVSGSTSSIIGNLDKGDYTIVSFQISQSAGGFPGMAGNASTSRDFSQMTEEERQAMRDQMQTTRDAATGNALKVEIEYTDTTGVRHTIEKDVDIQFRDISSTDSDTASSVYGFRQRTNSWASLIYYVIIAVIVVAAIVLYKKNKRFRSIARRILRRKGD